VFIACGDQNGETLDLDTSPALANPAVQNLRVTLEELFDRMSHLIPVLVQSPGHAGPTLTYRGAVTERRELVGHVVPDRRMSSISRRI
jgi:hypothetical protein